jgi:hypothetical protein
MTQPAVEPFISHSQVTVLRPAGDTIQTANGPMKWRRWLVLERARLLNTWVWQDLWIQDTPNGDAAMYGILTDRAVDLMAMPGGRSAGR